MLASTHSISTVVRVGAFVIFFFACFAFFIPWRYEAPPQFQPPTTQVTNLTEVSSTFNTSVVDFWQHLATTLLDAKPKCKPLKIPVDVKLRSNEWVGPLKREDEYSRRLAGYTDQDETAMLRAHYKMRRSAQHLAPKLPFSEGTTGIVVTANLDYMPVLIVSLRMVRRTGCNLPMEVFIDDWSQYNKSTCDHVLPSLGARCIILTNILRNTTQITKPNHFQHKALSILFSSFQNVLYLDTDTFPIYDPTILFTVPPYTTHGLVTWPDVHAPAVSEHYYHIAAIPHDPSQMSTSSGQILINKAIHRESLIMMIYYNYYGPSYYYPLLSSEHETYIHAALATRLPVYQVRMPPAVLGRWWNGTYRATGLAQADPGTDLEYIAPWPSHIHPGNRWEKTDLAHPNLTVETALNYTRHAPHAPRPVFVHHNVLKMHPAKLLLDKEEVTFEPDGTPHRMWGLRDDAVRILGYDVEERLWGVVVEEGCREDRASEECTRLLEWSREVVGWMGTIDRPW